MRPAVAVFVETRGRGQHPLGQEDSRQQIQTMFSAKGVIQLCEEKLSTK